VAGGEPREPAQSESGESSTSPEASGDLSDRHAVASEIGDVSFPVSVRGYDRGAVDAYVSRVEQLVAELEVTRSPEAAVKQALEQVGEQTKRLLEEAGVTAGQITVTARQEAEDSTARGNVVFRLFSALLRSPQVRLITAFKKPIEGERPVDWENCVTSEVLWIHGGREVRMSGSASEGRLRRACRAKSPDGLLTACDIPYRR
jgi:DivIVA domain-containing protein